uniref:Holin n=1 Tax=viral metagenome TaxID=1070528 RepID=A0A6H1ZF62_9ZZZZ
MYQYSNKDIGLLIERENNMRNFYKSKRFWTGLAFVITWLGFYATGERTLNEIISNKDFLIGVEGLLLWVVAMISGQQVAFGKRNLFGGKIKLDK